MKSVTTFIHLQQAENGERTQKKKAAIKQIGQANRMSTKNQMTAHSHWRAIFGDNTASFWCC